MSPSPLLSLSSKLLRKFARRSSHTLGIRMFSSSTTNPYLLCYADCYSSPEAIDIKSEIHYFDPVKEDEVIVRDKMLPMEFHKSGRLVGMSHGWGVFKVQGDDYYVSDHYNPCGSKLSPKTIPLYPLNRRNPLLMFGITNAAMTCSPDQSNDFAVALNTLGPLINFSRPGGKHKYSGSICFRTPFRYFDQSKVMYSKRDEKFYSPSIGGHFLISWDSFFEECMASSQLHLLHFSGLPELTQSEWELLDSCSKTVYLVESPSGQRFLIKWYAQNHKPGQALTFLCRGTKRFMVFKEEEETRSCLTQRTSEISAYSSAITSPSASRQAHSLA